MQAPVQRLSPKRTTLWLVVILTLTAILWSGSSRIGLATDDYHYLHTLAPISGIGDVFDAFTRADANPHYWRPVSNFTLMLDFLLYGWSGGGYHITNLILHLIATLLVFRVSRSIFKLDERVSLVAAFLFGISAGHDMNLLWVAARGDILVTIFCLATLLLLRKEGVIWQIASIIAFFLALCSKELAVLLVPIAAYAVWKNNGFKTTAIRTVSLTLVAILFFILRSSFTESVSGADPMLGEGMSDPLAALRNVAYGIGYVLLPLDLSSAATVVSSYRIEAFILACVLLVTCVALFAKSVRSTEWKKLTLPFLFFLVFSVIVAQSFERWRLYAPSVGLYAIIAFILVHLWNTSTRVRKWVIALPVAVLIVFHIFRAHVEQHTWHHASFILEETKEQLKPVLQASHDKPLLFLTRPSKIGGGSIMKVSNMHLVLQSKAELLNVPELRNGGIGDVKAEIGMAMQVLALDPTEHFAPVTVEKLEENVYRVSVPEASSTRLLAETAETGSRPRERRLQPGDSLNTAVGLAIVNTADRNYAISATLYLKPHNSHVVYFDGSSLRSLE